MKQRTTKGVPPLGSLDVSVPPAVEAVVTKCLERDPSARFQNAGELVAALGRLDAEGGLIRTPAGVSRRVAVLVSLLVTVSLVAVYVVGAQGSAAAGRRARAGVGADCGSSERDRRSVVRPHARADAEARA